MARLYACLWNILTSISEKTLCFYVQLQDKFYLDNFVIYQGIKNQHKTEKNLKIKKNSGENVSNDLLIKFPGMNYGSMPRK